MKKCYRIMIKMLLCAAIFCGLVYGLAITYFPDRIIGWRIARLEAALRKANPQWDSRRDFAGFDADGITIISMIVDSSSMIDLTPLMGMALEKICLDDTNVSDLTPLKGMPLTELSMVNTKVTDLTPLKGLPLKRLWLDNTNVSDLTPLKGMPLVELSMDNTKVGDLTPLKGMPLAKLSMVNTKVGDLTPLKGMPLTELFLLDTPASKKMLPKWLDRKMVHGSGCIRVGMGSSSDPKQTEAPKAPTTKGVHRTPTAESTAPQEQEDQRK